MTRRLLAALFVVSATAGTFAAVALTHSVPPEGATFGCTGIVVPVGGFPEGTHTVTVQVRRDGILLVDRQETFTGTQASIAETVDLAGRHAVDVSVVWTDDGGGSFGQHVELDLACGGTDTVTSTVTSTVTVPGTTSTVTVPGQTSTVSSTETVERTVTAPGPTTTIQAAAVTAPAVTSTVTRTVMLPPAAKTFVRVVTKIRHVKVRVCPTARKHAATAEKTRPRFTG